MGRIIDVEKTTPTTKPSKLKRKKYVVTQCFVVSKDKMVYSRNQIIELTAKEAKALGTLVKLYVEGK